MLSPSQLSNAEKQLGHMLGDNGFRFKITDPTDTKHNELILVDPSKEHKVKKIYRDILTLFPSHENELAKQLSEAIDHMEADSAKTKLVYERKLSKAQLIAKDASIGRITAESQVAIKDAQLIAKDESIGRITAEAQLATKDALHRVEVLELQLQIERMKHQE